MIGIIIAYIVGTLVGIILTSVSAINTLKEREERYTGYIRSLSEETGKIIDTMAEHLVGLSIWGENNDEIVIFNTSEQVKKYFKNKVKK